MKLITAATGEVGRPLIRALLREGVEVAALTRDPGAAFPAGVRVIVGDPREPDSIPWDGVTDLYVNPRAVGPAAAALLAAARAHGVRKAVVQSSYNVDEPFERQPSRALGDRNAEVEAAVRASGLTWVALRASVFAINTVSMWGAQLAAGDVVHGATPSFVEVPIDPLDVAEVAAVALTTDTLDNTAPVLTGPEALALTEMLAALGAVLDRDLRFVEVPAVALRAAMVERGAPADLVDAMLARQSRPSGLLPTGEVERILGRPARSLADWAAEHAAAFTAPVAVGGGSR